MNTAFTLEQIERYRDRTHRRTAGRAVRSKARALSFINEVGFCFAFKADRAELPCLWNAVCGERNPVMPLHTHHDPAISFVWQMKDLLPAEGKIYYGKLLRGRPTMVSLEYLPHFFLLSGRKGGHLEYRAEAEKGKLSLLAREILDALRDSYPQSTRGLKLATGHVHAGARPAFDKAVGELQSRMYIVKVAEEYDPFGFVWAPLEKTFPSLARKAARLTPDTARVAILEKYFENQFTATVDEIARLFRWDKQAIFRALGALTHRGLVMNGVYVGGDKRKYYCLVNRR
jgi:hypothetical protein